MDLSFVTSLTPAFTKMHLLLPIAFFFLGPHLINPPGVVVSRPTLRETVEVRRR